MRVFDFKKTASKLLTNDIVNMLGYIHEYKGQQNLFIEAKADVVVGGESVEADGGGVQSGCHEGIQPFAGEEESVGHHPPWESAFVDGSSAFLQVAAHQGFASRHHHEYLVWVGLGGHAVQHAQEVLLWHVGCVCGLLAVASAVPAVQVASQGTFPEELPQWVLLHAFVLDVAGDFQCQCSS